jgi:hypothetical protein
MTSEEEISKDPTHNSLVVFGFMTEDSMLFLKVLMRWGTSLTKKTCRSRAYKFVDLYTADPQLQLITDILDEALSAVQTMT